MKLACLTIIALIAFALNSILTRYALGDGYSGAAAFSLVRLVAGAITLYSIVFFQRGVWRPNLDMKAACALAVYAIGFSFAYISLDAGVGALLLFAVVQITLFGFAYWTGETITVRRWLGSGLALFGIMVLVWPTEAVNLKLSAVLLMALSAIGWGAYTAMGRSSSNPLVNTAQNFIWAAPIAIAVYIAIPDVLSWQSFMAAFVAGAITSGIGYAIWYVVLPDLETSFAAVLQLSVPILAGLFGAMLLGEILTPTFWISATLVVLGTLISIYKKS